jgi:hypothetical protein
MPKKILLEIAESVEFYKENIPKSKVSLKKTE